MHRSRRALAQVIENASRFINNRASVQRLVASQSRPLLLASI